MKIKRALTLLAATVCMMAATAQDKAAAPDPAAQALASRLRGMYPKTTFTEVRASGVAGLYEVVMGNNVAYTDDTGRYFVFGHLFDMQTQVDLTAQRLPAAKQIEAKPAAAKVEFPIKDLANAIKTVKGNGSRKLAVFSDPACSYCKRLETELAKLDNVTIYTFLFPILGPESKTLSVATWCAPDPSAAWSALMIQDKRPRVVSCTTPIDENLVLGSRLGINGTPTLIAADGRFMPGAASAERIDQWLNLTQ